MFIVVISLYVATQSFFLCILYHPVAFSERQIFQILDPYNIDSICSCELFIQQMFCL